MREYFTQIIYTENMSNDSEIITNIQASPAVAKAIKKILYPLVSLLMRTGVHFPQFSELLKEVYVDVANKEFTLNNKKQTQTRLSFITGVHRKDVKRFQDDKTDKNQKSKEPENINLGVQLISIWLKEPRYQDKHGKPLLLPLKSKTEPSFDELVEKIYKQNIRSRVILDEWLNSGIVVLKDKKVQLCSEGYIPKENQDEKAFFLGQNIADHLSAASQNLLNDSPEFFERCVYYEDLSQESILNLKTFVNENGMNLLKKINQRAAELKQQDKRKSSSKQRINIGLYLYHQNKA